MQKSVAVLLILSAVLCGCVSAYPQAQHPCGPPPGGPPPKGPPPSGPPPNGRGPCGPPPNGEFGPPSTTAASG